MLIIILFFLLRFFVIHEMFCQHLSFVFEVLTQDSYSAGGHLLSSVLFTRHYIYTKHALKIQEHCKLF